MHEKNMRPQKLYELGEQYYYGRGVPRSYERAFNLSLIAAKKGYAPAQTRVGFCYEHGQGVEYDYGKGFELTKLAEDRII